MKRIIFLAAGILLVASCVHNSGIRRQLGDIENYINEMPDSALAALENIPAERLITSRLKAKHALLYSIALDKNYLGRIHENNLNYTQSILAFTNALEYAERTNDSFYKGLVYRGLADDYSSTFNHTEELRYRQLEYDSFMEAGAIRYAYFALKGSGNAYASTDNREQIKARREVDNVVDGHYDQQQKKFF